MNIYAIYLSAWLGERKEGKRWQGCEREAGGRRGGEAERRVECGGEGRKDKERDREGNGWRESRLLLIKNTDDTPVLLRKLGLLPVAHDCESPSCHDETLNLCGKKKFQRSQQLSLRLKSFGT